MSHPSTQPARVIGTGLLALCGIAAQAATLRVPDQYPTIQAAIDAAAVAGDVVLVSPGTYFENLVVTSKSLDIEGVGGRDQTIIDGGYHGAVVTIRAGGGQLAGLTGFTLQHGSSQEGGGVDAQGTAVIDDCLIQNNTAREDGGGVSFTFGDASVLRHSRIVDNTADEGGGIYAGYGSSSIEGNSIKANFGSSAGGGLYIAGGNNVVDRNVIAGNTSNYHPGGGMYVLVAADGSPIVSSNLIVDNRGGSRGGGIEVEGNSADPVATFVNNTVVDNHVYDDEGVDADGAELTVWGVVNHVVFANNIFSGGPAVTCGGRFKPKSPKFFHNDVFPVADGSCGLTATTGTNMKIEPQFVAGQDAHPYHLPPDSPLVDAGSNRHARGLHRDLDDLPRVVDGGNGRKVDIGAFEYQGH